MAREFPLVWDRVVELGPRRRGYTQKRLNTDRCTLRHNMVLTYNIYICAFAYVYIHICIFFSGKPGAHDFGLRAVNFGLFGGVDRGVPFRLRGFPDQALGMRLRYMRYEDKIGNQFMADQACTTLGCRFAYEPHNG